MKNVILNRSNILPGSNNSKLEYQFPNTEDFRQDQVALASIDIPFSWDNITTALNNNYFSYIWNDGSGSTEFQVIIPNGGYYFVEDLNALFQFVMFNNGHYLINSDGNTVYYAALTYNRLFLSVEMRCDPLPTSLPAGWSDPAGVIVFPVSPIGPQIKVPSTKFRTLIGFTNGTYPAVPSTITYNELGTSPPEFYTTSTIVVLCSLLTNPLSRPNVVLYSFPAVAQGYAYGSLIRINVPSLVFTDIQDQFQKSFTLALLNQDFNPIIIRDPQMLIQLVFRKRNEVLLK